VSDNFTAIFGLFCGVLCIIAAVFDWDWFMNHSRSRLFVDLFGREGARLFYGVLGCIIIALSIGLGGF